MILAIIISFFVGGFIGAACMGLVVASSNQERAEEKHRREQEENVSDYDDHCDESITPT